MWLNSHLSRTEISLSVPWSSPRAFHHGQDCCHVSTAGSRCHRSGCARTHVASCIAPSPPAHTRHMQQPHCTRTPLGAPGCSYTAGAARTAREASAGSCCMEHGWHGIPSRPEKSAFPLRCNCISMGIEQCGCVRCGPRVLLPVGAQELLPGAWCPPCRPRCLSPRADSPSPVPAAQHRQAGLPATVLGPSCLPASANTPRCAPAKPASNCCLTLSI